jgi:hypothetical protein
MAPTHSPCGRIDPTRATTCTPSARIRSCSARSPRAAVHARRARVNAHQNRAASTASTASTPTTGSSRTTRITAAVTSPAPNPPSAPVTPVAAVPRGPTSRTLLCPQPRRPCPNHLARSRPMESRAIHPDIPADRNTASDRK